MIEKHCEILKKTRQSILNVIAELSIEELNEMPQGFNNNIIWNLGHMIASQQGICYSRGSHELRIKDEFFQTYKPGSKPEGFVNAGHFEEIKLLLFSTIDTMETDYKSGLFDKNPPWVTRSGVELNTIDDTMKFLLFHDGLHNGVITALRKAVMGSKV